MCLTWGQKLRNLDGAGAGAGKWWVGLRVAGKSGPEVQIKPSQGVCFLVHITVFIVNKPETFLKMCPEYLIERVISICDLQLKVYRSFIHHYSIDSLWFCYLSFSVLCKPSIKLGLSIPAMKDKGYWNLTLHSLSWTLINLYESFSLLTTFPVIIFKFNSLQRIFSLHL